MNMSSESLVSVLTAEEFFLVCQTVNVLLHNGRLSTLR